ncbi:DUF3341 domain-containing protein [Amorphus sp. 3PC139-8]|uniref:DUF3341 domain-containing protein n=1 Tax=Amorphus sp. 3PC139-8 TaxID=2735676 RepID=UPI00345D61DF
MTEPRPRYLLNFADETALKSALDRLPSDKLEIVDAFLPFGDEEIAERIGAGRNRLNLVTLVGGLCGAGFIFALQAYSFLVAYPFDSGGRPSLSWPAFLIPTFEIGVLAAVLAAAIAMFRANGLPRYHHPLFEVPRFERTTQDELALLVRSLDGSYPGGRDALLSFGATSVSEVWE